MEQKTVLIVEDDAIVVIHLRNILTKLGFRVSGSVATGEAAVAAVAATPPDLILMDIKLAGKLDGIAATRCIRAIADVPIIFLTSYTQHSLVQEAKATFPYGYLLKPVSQRELAVTIEMALNRHMLDRQIKANETALQNANTELEQRVQERTAELLSINQRLCQEIEKHKRTEISLYESKERYRRITQGLTDYLYTVSVREGRVVEVQHNQAAEVVTGYSSQEYAADPDLWKQLVLQEDRDRVSAQVQKIVNGETVSPIEIRILHKNRQIRWVSNTLIPEYDCHGILVAFDGLLKDITERKAAEEKLFTSKATLTTVFDGISQPLIMLDATLRVKRLNRAAKDYFALHSYQEASGKLCYEAFRGRSSPCRHCEYPFSSMQGYSGSYERRGEEDPDKLEKVVVDLVQDESGGVEAYIICISDITQARLMDRKLIQSEKLASLGLLIAGIAHEINNPNNFIYFNTPILRSYIQFLLSITDDYFAAHPELEAFGRSYPAFREDCFKLLDNIEHGSSRINQIVDNLRGFVRERGKGEKCRIDLKQVMEKGISLCFGRIKKVVKTFEVHIPEGLPSFIADPLAIEQVVVNLLVNAVQAMDKENSWIELKVTGPKEPKGEIFIEVADNGCGMDLETKKKIFDPFFTTKATGDGTGLGLTISHRLVMEMGGRIEVCSEPGKGSIFRVVLKVTS
ncbi:MAG: ATP-binding protein [Pseudomonadota bacterium]